MSVTAYHIQPYGARAILIQWREPPSQALFLHLNAVKKVLAQRLDCEIVLTYQELLLKNLAPTAKNIKEIEQCFREKKEHSFSEQKQRRIRIPVCYDLEFGVDLETLAQAKNRSISELIELHTTPEYFVYFLGFLPGFPYLLGLDQGLHTPRKDVPARRLVAGSVAIGGEQTGIYPQDSPGGWHVIGHCPIPLFDASASESTLFMPGDLVTFDAITKQEHKELSKMSLVAYCTSTNVSYG